MTGRLASVRLAARVRHLRRDRTPVADRLAALRRHAVENSPFYRRLHVGQDGAPLADLTPVTKAHLMGAFDEVVADPQVRLAAVERHVKEAEPGTPFLGRYRVGVTSGSSARPGTFVFDRDEWAALIANAAESRAIAQAPEAGPGPASRQRSAKIGSPLGWHLSAQVGATLADPRRPVLRLSAATPIAQLADELATWQPASLTAYPSLLGLLADEQEAGRVAIRPHQVLAGAEPLTDDIRRRVRAAWSVDVFDQYAIGEAGFLAVECPAHDGLHVMDRHVVLEVVGDDHEAVADGEEGSRVLVTALTSRLVPLIRYEVPDRARLIRDPCPCGRSSPRIVVSGRARDVLRFTGPAGVEVVHPVVFTRVMDTQRVATWQVVREDGGVRVVVSGPGATFDGDALAAAVTRSLAEVLAVPPPVRVEVVENVTRGPGGKASLVVDRTVADA
jgi:phenylacetate-CoA ligase